MAHIVVDVEQMRQVATQFSNAHQDVLNQLTQLQGQVNGLEGANWQGVSRQHFDGQWTSYQQQVRNMAELLQQTSAHLTNTATAFEQTDTSATF